MGSVRTSAGGRLAAAPLRKPLRQQPRRDADERRGVEEEGEAAPAEVQEGSGRAWQTGLGFSAVGTVW